MSSDLEKIILDRLIRLEEKIDAIANNGCSKVQSHIEIKDNQADIFKRINLLEIARAEQKGKWSMVCIAVGIVATLAINYLSKRMGWIVLVILLGLGAGCVYTSIKSDNGNLRASRIACLYPFELGSLSYTPTNGNVRLDSYRTDGGASIAGSITASAVEAGIKTALKQTP